MALAHGYPQAWVYAAVRGFFAGRFGLADLYEHPYYRDLPVVGVERWLFRHNFDRGRTRLVERVTAGLENMPGSTYDPALDDGLGAFTDKDYKAYFRLLKEEHA
jgi:hypothetical protein